MKKPCLATGIYSFRIIINLSLTGHSFMHASTGIIPFFLNKCILVHAQLESAVGGSLLPQILTESEYLKHIDALMKLQEQYCVKLGYTEYSLCTN